MPGDAAILLEARVIEARPNGTFQVELANGHRLCAFGARRLRAALAGLAPGDPVVLEMTPCDFSKGRIVQTVRPT